jgi:hypothetical protein
MVPMGQKLFGSLNPVHTGGPMQVSIAFAEKHTDGYPWKIDGTVRQEVFSLRGGLWFGTYHLLNYPANYSEPLYRFADFNAGWYASRNAAFQKCGQPRKRREAGAGRRSHRLRQQRGGKHRAGGTEIIDTLDMSNSDIRRQLEKGDSLAFEKTDLYKKVFALAEQKSGKTLPRAILPGIQLESPKITRNLTTAWFAKRVDDRRARCMGFNGGGESAALTPQRPESYIPRGRDQAEQGADAKANLNSRASVILHLHQVFINAWRMDQHIEQLRAGPEAEQHKQGIRDIARRGGFWFAAKNRFRQCKVSHVDLPGITLF